MICKKIYSLGQEIKIFQLNNENITLIGVKRIWIFEKITFKCQIDLAELEPEASEPIINCFEVSNYIFIFRENSILVLDKDELEIFKK